MTPPLTHDVIIIGGGIIGQMTAYRLQQAGCRCLILEKTKPRNPDSGSNGLTRSIRCDYPDPLYIGWAIEAQRLWRELEIEAGTEFYQQYGLVNLVPPDPYKGSGQCYASLVYQAMQKAGVSSEWLEDDAVPLPFQAAAAGTDPSGGLLDLEAIFGFLATRKLEIFSEVEIINIRVDATSCTVVTNQGDFIADKIIIAAGLGTPAILKRATGIEQMSLPLSAAKPKAVRYYYPPDQSLAHYTIQKLPVFACLDLGIYGHPILPERTPGVKIGYYTPPNVTLPSSFNGIDDFVRLMAPNLASFPNRPVLDTDTGSYDMTPDGDFILGSWPDTDRLLIAAGWNGTGFKFAPKIAASLMDQVLTGGSGSSPARFAPGRFMQGA